MDRLSVDLPGDVSAKVRQKASRAGYASAEEYAKALLVQDAERADEADPGAPSHLSYERTHELENLLLERLEGGRSIEATPAFWDALDKQIARRQRKSKSA
ncbi:MAG TPA: hypothetical protein VLI90_00595 [Tepidisphaeraceae bacterium]|nr:hypothetical protein [Tepidisphaeraceae bacterium]